MFALLGPTDQQVRSSSNTKTIVNPHKVSLCGCGSGVEPVSCYWKLAGLIRMVCMSKCPLARY